MGKIIGIDLGTTNSCVALREGAALKVIENDEGARTTPSAVAFTGSETLVGAPALRQASANPKRTVRAVKRLMGRRFADAPARDVARAASFGVAEGPGGAAWVEVGGKARSPEEISALILAKMKAAAERHLGEPVTEAVVTVPAYFNESQRQATKDAGRIAGLEVKRILNEPTAAALAFGLDKEGFEGKVAVFDLGGGTFDISVIEISREGGQSQFETLATGGDSHLGGEDFDQRLIQWIASDFQAQEGVDLLADPLASQRLREAAERAKKELSSSTSTDISLPYITATPAGPKHLSAKISRAKLESLVEDLIERAMEPCRQALADAKVSPEGLKAVLLVGGQTRMPAVAEAARKLFGREPRRDVNPDEAVALGAAAQAAVLAGEIDDALLLDATPLSLGVEVHGGLAARVIERNSTIPTRASERFATAADGQTAAVIRVVQGERPMAADNVALGEFALEGFDARGRGLTQVEVTFDLDANGMLTVSAREPQSGKSAQIAIKGSSSLGEARVQELVEQARKHAAEDAERRALAEAKNRLESLAWEAGKALAEGESSAEIDRATAVLDDAGASRPGVEAAREALERWLAERRARGGGEGFAQAA
jgi:molecular chaperone DnaK